MNLLLIFNTIRLSNSSWDNNGKSDIPAMIDTIMSATPWTEKIHYVGHSMGTTAFMVMMNERPEYADKIIMANFLAPVAYVEHMKSPIRLLAPFADSIEVITLTNITTEKSLLLPISSTIEKF